MLTTLMLALAAQAAAPEGRPPAPPSMGMMGADADGDGAITRAEAVAQAEKRFARIDTNKDGRITREEVVNLRERREFAGRSRTR